MWIILFETINILRNLHTKKQTLLVCWDAPENFNIGLCTWFPLVDVHCWTTMCILKWFHEGLRLLSDIWSENAALFKRLMKNKQTDFQGAYTGWPRNNDTVDTDDFSGLCSDQQLSLFTLLDRASFSHYINTKIIKFDWELFILWVNFLWTVIFGICSIFLSFEVRWHINGKSRKWLSVRNYS